MFFFVLFLFLFFISCSKSQDTCSQNYFSCISNQRRNPWDYRRPYQDYNSASRCLIDAGCNNQLDYKRSVFADFIPEWQHIANKMWQEFLSTPETVKQCIRLIVVTYTRQRLDQCVRSVGGTPLGKYPEDIELPYCGYQMPSSNDVNTMEVGLREKVNILHSINVCKDTRGQNTAVKASDCLDAIRKAYMVKNFCNSSSGCSSPSCAEYIKKNTVAMCQCARSFRDQAIASVDQMYATRTIKVIKLIPSFLGMELTPDITAQLKKCYTDAGLQPISLLNFLDDPMLKGSLEANINPKADAVQAVRELLYTQMDLPDYCENCS